MSERGTAKAAPKSPQRSDSRPAVTRRLAEWISLGISALIILGLAAYLLYQATQHEAPYILAEARPLLDQVERKEGTYILPIEVTNRGHHTLRDLQVQVTSHPPAAPPEQRSIKIDYLGEQSSQRLYVYLPADPRTLNVKVTPSDYRLE